MIIETWVVVLIVLFIFASAFVCAIGWMISDQRLEECHKEKDRMQEEIHYLRGKLIVKTANEFYNEGKKK
jgi:hypothetical protein